MAYFRSVRPQTRLRGESFAADGTVEGSVLRPFHLGVVIPQVLLEIGQLDEGSPAVRKVALVWTFAWNKNSNDIISTFSDYSVMEK